MSKILRMLIAGGKDFSDDECMVSGAALAYYTIFSLPPLMVVVFFIAGLFNISDEKINEVVRKQIGMPVAQSSQGDNETSNNKQANNEKSNNETDSNSGSLGALADRQSSSGSAMSSLGPLSKVIGALILIFSATGVFAQLQHALNRAWEVEPDPEAGGLKNFVMKRLLSLGMIVVVAFLLLVALVVTTLIDELVGTLVGSDPGTVAQTIGIIVNNLLALALSTLLFAAMYKILPDATMRWKDMWIGAFITAVLFVAGKTAIGWYLQNSQMGNAWGSAASSMIALLVWVYYTALIVLFGAELTQVWAKEFGHGITPEEGAVRIVEEKRHVRDTEEAT